MASRSRKFRSGDDKRKMASHLRELLEETLSGSDGKNTYRLAIEDYTSDKMEKEVSKHPNEIFALIDALQKAKRPQWWRENHTLRGSNSTGKVGETADGVPLNKTPFAGGS